MLGEILNNAHFFGHRNSGNSFNEYGLRVGGFIDLTKLLKSHGISLKEGDEKPYQKFRENDENIYITVVRGDWDGSLVIAVVYIHPEISRFHEVRITHRVGGVTISSSETFLGDHSWGGYFQIAEPDDTRLFRFGSSRCEMTDQSNPFYSRYLHVADAQKYLLGSESINNGVQITADFLKILFRGRAVGM